MAVDATKVEFGEGTLEVKVTSSPAESSWTDVGACQGADLMAKQEITDVDCGQKLNALTSFITGEECTLKIRMLEHTMRNLAITLGLHPGSDIASNATYEQIVFGDNTANVFMQLRYTVAQQDDIAKYFRLISEKTRAISGASMTFTKKEERMFEV